MPSVEGRARYEQLAEAATSGVVADDLVPALESLLDLALTQRPLAQPVLSGVFERTPRGQELRAAAREVNGALRSLQGQRLETMRLTAGPGRYSLTLETELVRLQLVFDQAGPRVETAEMG